MITQITKRKYPNNLQYTPILQNALTPKYSHLKKNFNVYDEIKRINEVGACINKNIPVDSLVGPRQFLY